MESARARRLTTILVAGGLIVATLSMIVAVALFVSRPDAASSTYVLALGDLGGGLADGDPSAWSTFSVLALLSTPFLRLVGMTLTFQAEQESRAMGSSLAIVAVVTGLVVFRLVIQ